MDALPDLGTPHLRFERRAGVAWCTIDRPEARGAITPAMYRGIGRALQAVADDPSLGALVLTGTDDVFTAGGDLSVPDDGSFAGQDVMDVLPFHDLLHTEVPVIAAINGLCQGSGLLLALLADVSVASRRAWFRAPELHRGFPETWFAAILPVHVGVARARDLMFTARRVDAEEAAHIGLIARVVDHDRLEVEAAEVARAVLQCAPRARAVCRRALLQRYEPIDDEGFRAGLTTPEAEEGFAAFLERRTPRWVPDAHTDH